jgi:hypothetical protein
MRALNAAFTFAIVTTLALHVPPASAAEGEGDAAASAAGIEMLILREDGTGGAARAKEYLTTVVDAVAKANGWSGATFEYFTDREKAAPWTKEHDPSYGILSFGAYLAMRAPHDLKMLGRAKAVGSGGGRYYIVSKKHHGLEGCKAGKLASNHGGDAKYIDKVVSGGAFELSDFASIEHTKRPVQTLKMVTRDEADCALIDHAQFEAMQEIDGGAELSTVWFSQEFPSIVIVAFPKAPKAQAATFHDKLASVCTGEGKKACGRTGVEFMVGVEPDAYDAHVKAYEGR